jgi:hypothetical protein
MAGRDKLRDRGSAAGATAYDGDFTHRIAPPE